MLGASLSHWINKTVKNYHPAIKIETHWGLEKLSKISQSYEMEELGGRGHQRKSLQIGNHIGTLWSPLSSGWNFLLAPLLVYNVLQQVFFFFPTDESFSLLINVFPEGVLSWPLASYSIVSHHLTHYPQCSYRCLWLSKGLSLVKCPFLSLEWQLHESWDLTFLFLYCISRTEHTSWYILNAQ